MKVRGCMLWRKKYTEEWRRYIVSMEDYEQAKVLIKVPLFGQNFQDDTLIIGKRKT